MPEGETAILPAAMLEGKEKIDINPDLAYYCEAVVGILEPTAIPDWHGEASLIDKAKAETVVRGVTDTDFSATFDMPAIVQELDVGPRGIQSTHETASKLRQRFQEFLSRRGVDNTAFWQDPMETLKRVLNVGVGKDISPMKFHQVSYAFLGMVGLPLMNLRPGEIQQLAAQPDLRRAIITAAAILVALFGLGAGAYALHRRRQHRSGAIGDGGTGVDELPSWGVSEDSGQTRKPSRPNPQLSPDTHESGKQPNRIYKLMVAGCGMAVTFCIVGGLLVCIGSRALVPILRGNKRVGVDVTVSQEQSTRDSIADWEESLKFSIPDPSPFDIWNEVVRMDTQLDPTWWLNPDNADALSRYLGTTITADDIKAMKRNRGNYVAFLQRLNAAGRLGTYGQQIIDFYNGRYDHEKDFIQWADNQFDESIFFSTPTPDPSHPTPTSTPDSLPEGELIPGSKAKYGSRAWRSTDGQGNTVIRFEDGTFKTIPPPNKSMFDWLKEV